MQLEVKPQIIWLASYPKSGNTWMRLFLDALYHGEEKQNPLESIEISKGIISSNSIIENQLGVSAQDVPENLLQKLRFDVINEHNKTLKEPAFIKVHDAAFHKGIQTFPKEATLKTIYIVRNPFDMIASYANHMSCTIERAIYLLNSGENMLAGSKKKHTDQVAQYLGSWSEHYNSWRNLMRDNIYIVRYEDMKENALATFSDLVKNIGWQKNESEILHAIKMSSFDKLQEKESALGFKEKPKGAEKFFRKGEVGGWRVEITSEQAQVIVDRHYNTLLELGYINQNGDILI